MAAREDEANMKQCHNIYTMENLKNVTTEMMKNEADTKYRHFALTTAFSNLRLPVDESKFKSAQLQNGPRVDPDRAKMPI